MISDSSQQNFVESSAKESLAQDELFKAQAQKLSLFLASEGVYVRTFARGLPFFSKLSLEQKQKANKHLGCYVELCREQMSEGYSLKDGASFLWRALRKLNLVPRSDLFQNFSDDSVIEIYSSDNVQLYRNINFFKYCSYTLEELHSLEWWLLFDRDSKINDLLYGMVSKLVSGEVKENIIMDVPVHTMSELESAEKFVIEMDFEVIGPLTCNKVVSAFVVSSSAKIISSTPVLA